MSQPLPPDSAAVLAWRARLGLDQRSAAAALGLTLTAYQEIERGRSFSGNKPRGVKGAILLACAAIEKKIPPIA